MRLPLLVCVVLWCTYMPGYNKKSNYSNTLRGIKRKIVYNTIVIIYSHKSNNLFKITISSLLPTLNKSYTCLEAIRYTYRHMLYLFTSLSIFVPPPPRYGRTTITDSGSIVNDNVCDASNHKLRFSNFLHGIQRRASYCAHSQLDFCFLIILCVINL